MEQKVLNRKFGLIIGAACLFISIYQQLVRHHFSLTLTVVGASLVLTALTVPLILNPIRILWGKIGDVLGMINTAIILFLVFFLVISPIGLIMRLLGKQGLDLKTKPGGSYWKPTKPAPSSTLEQQF
jgi:nitrate/nitrite transporter NarK